MQPTSLQRPGGKLPALLRRIASMLVAFIGHYAVHSPRVVTVDIVGGTGNYLFAAVRVEMPAGLKRLPMSVPGGSKVRSQRYVGYPCFYA